MSDALAALAAHSKARDLKPAQQVKLVLGYLVIRLLFPSITFADYLVAADRLIGATDANRLFPKDALDHWCPTKGSQWPPEERLRFMAAYIDYATATGPEALSLDGFLSAVIPPDATQTAPPAEQPPAQPPPQPAVVAQPEAPVNPSTVVPASAIPSGPPATTQTTLLPETPGLQPSAEALPFKLVIERAHRTQANQYFAMPTAVGGVPLGQSLLSFDLDGHGGKLHVDVGNGEPRPYIDIYFERGGEVVADRPADNTITEIVGTYVIRGIGGEYAVEITSK